MALAKLKHSYKVRVSDMYAVVRNERERMCDKNVAVNVEVSNALKLVKIVHLSYIQ